MHLGVPREVKTDESRVAVTPSGVSGLVAHGHRVRVESGAGRGSRISDDAYRAAGAEIVADAEEVWRDAELVLKVKEPIDGEYPFLRPGLVLFTYLHLAANEPLTRALLDSRVRAVGYETVQLADGSLPLLAPMSEVAGRLSIQVGAWCLQAENGGRGVLLGGASGVRPAKVVILGAGIAGANACKVAVGVGAHVSILDVNPARLRYVHDILGGHVTTVMSNRANIEEELVTADLTIGSVLIPGARAPHLVPRSLVRRMGDGSAIVDISIDQGGCVETARPTTHHDPIYLEEGVVHYCVTNMPGIVPHTSTYALTNATLSYALAIADHGLEAAARDSAPLRRAINVYDGKVTHPGVAEAFGLSFHRPEDAIGTEPSRAARS
jgi:alanine dehydrogenase